MTKKTKRYESSEPGTRLWLAGLGYEGYGAVFAANVWARMRDVDVATAVELEQAAQVDRAARLAPADPFDDVA